MAERVPLTDEQIAEWQAAVAYRAALTGAEAVVDPSAKAPAAGSLRQA